MAPMGWFRVASGRAQQRRHQRTHIRTSRRTNVSEETAEKGGKPRPLPQQKPEAPSARKMDPSLELPGGPSQCRLERKVVLIGLDSHGSPSDTRGSRYGRCSPNPIPDSHLSYHNTTVLFTRPRWTKFSIQQHRAVLSSHVFLSHSPWCAMQGFALASMRGGGRTGRAARGPVLEL
ncbi:hypothetical protein LZ30DRAFT_216165 [Colletotrichum cereale]|nr:hypothetical protein LZ30DRAFT_216165 [Colletotrichum cereale]